MASRDELVARRDARREDFSNRAALRNMYGTTDPGNIKWQLEQLQDSLMQGQAVRDAQLERDMASNAAFDEQQRKMQYYDAVPADGGAPDEIQFSMGDVQNGQYMPPPDIRDVSQREMKYELNDRGRAAQETGILPPPPIDPDMLKDTGGSISQNGQRVAIPSARDLRNNMSASAVPKHVIDQAMVEYKHNLEMGDADRAAAIFQARVSGQAPPVEMNPIVGALTNMFMPGATGTMTMPAPPVQSQAQHGALPMPAPQATPAPTPQAGPIEMSFIQPNDTVLEENQNQIIVRGSDGRIYGIDKVTGQRIAGGS